MSVLFDKLEADIVRLFALAKGEIRKRDDQLKDAMDEIYRLNVTVRERDELIAELQQINTSRRTGR